MPSVGVRFFGAVLDLRSRMGRRMALVLALGLIAASALMFAPASQASPPDIGSCNGGTESFQGSLAKCVFSAGATGSFIVPHGISHITVIATGGVGQAGGVGNFYGFIPCG